MYRILAIFLILLFSISSCRLHKLVGYETYINIMKITPDSCDYILFQQLEKIKVLTNDFPIGKAEPEIMDRLTLCCQKNIESLTFIPINNDSLTIIMNESLRDSKNHIVSISKLYALKFEDNLIKEVVIRDGPLIRDSRDISRKIKPKNRHVKIIYTEN